MNRSSRDWKYAPLSLVGLVLIALLTGLGSIVHRFKGSDALHRGERIRTAMSDSVSENTVPDDVRQRLTAHAREETNAEGVTVERTDTGTRVRLLYHPPQRRPIVAPAGRGRGQGRPNSDDRQTLVIMGAAQKERKLTYDEVVDRFQDISNADHIDYLDFDHHYEVQLVYNSDFPEW